MCYVFCICVGFCGCVNKKRFVGKNLFYYYAMKSRITRGYREMEAFCGAPIGPLYALLVLIGKRFTVVVANPLSHIGFPYINRIFRF